MVYGLYNLADDTDSDRLNVIVDYYILGWRFKLKLPNPFYSRIPPHRMFSARLRCHWVSGLASPYHRGLEIGLRLASYLAGLLPTRG